MFLKVFLLFISLVAFAAETKGPTVEELQHKVTELETKLSIQVKISQKFHDMADQCQINLVYGAANQEVSNEVKEKDGK